MDCGTLITIYQSIIQPHFDYCTHIWSCFGKGLSDKLQKLQNRAFRMVPCENYDMRSFDILKNVGVCNLQDRREQQLVILMHKKEIECYKIIIQKFSQARILFLITIREIANLISRYLIQ